MKNAEYKSNTEPKVGDKVRTGRDIRENGDYLYEVTSVLGGRVGNKVGIRLVEHPTGRPIGPREESSLELYYYCLCPQ